MQKSSSRIRGIPFSRTFDELSSARGERRGDGSFGTDRPHPPPESTKKGLSCNTVKSMSSEPTPLPPDRVTDCAPFEIVGIDLAGPLFLKDGRKVWIKNFVYLRGIPCYSS
ncbi:hypothetical protein TNCV_505801 [Trichonephila clavipes]|nr:hypothetical protein TNCV_505801 [Trichonephila clavipes]